MKAKKYTLIKRYLKHIFFQPMQKCRSRCNPNNAASPKRCSKVISARSCRHLSFPWFKDRSFHPLSSNPTSTEKQRKYSDIVKLLTSIINGKNMIYFQVGLYIRIRSFSEDFHTRKVLYAEDFQGICNHKI